MPVIKVCGRFVSFSDGKWPQDLIMVIGSSGHRVIGSSGHRLIGAGCAGCADVRVRGVLGVLGVLGVRGGGSEPNGW